MVSLIPRLSSFAVSGTPAKTQPADLIHVLRYVTPLLFLHNHLTRTFQINIDSYEWIRLLEVHDFGKGCWNLGLWKNLQSFCNAMPSGAVLTETDICYPWLKYLVYQQDDQVKCRGRIDYSSADTVLSSYWTRQGRRTCKFCIALIYQYIEWGPLGLRSNTRVDIAGARSWCERCCLFIWVASWQQLATILDPTITGYVYASSGKHFYICPYNYLIMVVIRLEHCRRKVIICTSPERSRQWVPC